MIAHIRAKRQRATNAASRDQRPVIAVVVDAVFPHHLGGREVRYHELTQRLADRASIHVYTMNWWRGSRAIQDRGVTYHAITRLRPMYDHGHRSIKQALFFAIGCLRLVYARFDILEADHIPYLHVLVLRGIATLRRKPLIVTWHEVWGKAYWKEYLGAKGSVAWIVEWLAMRLPEQIIAASPQTADRLRSILGAKAAIAVAPNGVDLNLIKDTYPDPSSSDLVVVGRLIDHKRVGMLLDAMALLHAEGTPVTCRIIGDGPDREALHGKAEELGLAKVVDFRHDIREQKEVYALVKAAKVAVFPSDREGFGAAVLEALACGVPVVTTSSPDNLAQHLARRSCRGHICEPSAAAIAATLVPLLAATSGLLDQADDWLVDHSWEAVAEQVGRALGINELE